MKLYKITADEQRLSSELMRIGVDPYALRMAAKGIALNILIKDVRSPAANILKQESIASGIDAAVKRGVVSCSVEISDVLLLGNINAYGRLCKRLESQPFGLRQLSLDIKALLGKERKPYFMARGIKINLERPLVMGILNATPDSFSDGGDFISADSSKQRVDAMMADGADIIDIGGMSSRPGAEHVAPSVEIKRIDTALGYALDKGAIVSVDTYSAETAIYALKRGAHIINDIKGLESDAIVAAVKEYGAAVCIMHMRGIPVDMQDNTAYDNIVHDISDFFSERVAKAVCYGISEESIILDVGFGFGKSLDQNYTLLKYMKEFDIFGLPLLAGISRKSMIGSVCGKDVKERLFGTIAANAVAVVNGADIIRVHDVPEGVDTVKVCYNIRKAEVQ